MADGKTHFKSNIVASVPITIVGTLFAWITNDSYLLIPIITGNILGIILTPDIDQPGSTYTETLIREIIIKTLSSIGFRKSTVIPIGKFFQRLFMATTSFYSVVIPHRSWLSHFPGISVLTKTLYLWLFYVLFMELNDLSYVKLFDLFNNYDLQIILVVWTIHDFIHTFYDGFMIHALGKNRYFLGKPFYQWSLKLWK